MNSVLSLLGLSQYKVYVYLFLSALLIGTLGWTHWKAFSGGKSYVYSKLAEDRIEVFKDGKQIDTKVLKDSSTDDGLCAFLGGC